MNNQETFHWETHNDYENDFVAHSLDLENNDVVCVHNNASEDDAYHIQIEITHFSIPMCFEAEMVCSLLFAKVFAENKYLEMLNEADKLTKEIENEKK